MNKRERLGRMLANEATDRLPVALWRHFPGDDQRAPDFAAATLDWQRRFDWDCVVISPAESYPVVDHGFTDRWAGNIYGTREPLRLPIQKAVNWLDLRVIEPNRGMLRQTTDALLLIRDGLEPGTPFLQTIYSPLAQAQILAGTRLLTQHIRTAPERLKTGLATLTESTIRYVDSLRRSGICGIYYVARMASFGALTDAEYREFGRPYDLRVLEIIPRDWWLNIAYLPGELAMFDVFSDYPVQALNWHDRESEPDLAGARMRFGGALCGGIGPKEPLHDLTPTEIRSQARNAIEQANSRRLILGAGGPIPITTPLANLRAVRAVVEANG
jgi:uroporphyrinogen decarboxylase